MSLSNDIPHQQVIFRIATGKLQKDPSIITRSSGHCKRRKETDLTSDIKLNQVYELKWWDRKLFANVSIGYAQGMCYLSSLGLKCEVKNNRTVNEKITRQNEPCNGAKIDSNWKRKSDRLAEREKQKYNVKTFEVEVAY